MKITSKTVKTLMIGSLLSLSFTALAGIQTGTANSYITLAKPDEGMMCMPGGGGGHSEHGGNAFIYDGIDGAATVVDGVITDRGLYEGSWVNGEEDWDEGSGYTDLDTFFGFDVDFYVTGVSYNIIERTISTVDGSVTLRSSDPESLDPLSKAEFNQYAEMNHHAVVHARWEGNDRFGEPRVPSYGDTDQVLLILGSELTSWSLPEGYGINIANSFIGMKNGDWHWTNPNDVELVDTVAQTEKEIYIEIVWQLAYDDAPATGDDPAPLVNVNIEPVGNLAAWGTQNSVSVDSFEQDYPMTEAVDLVLTQAHFHDHVSAFTLDIIDEDDNSVLSLSGAPANDTDWYVAHETIWDGTVPYHSVDVADEGHLPPGGLDSTVWNGDSSETPIRMEAGATYTVSGTLTIDNPHNAQPDNMNVWGIYIAEVTE